MLVHFVDSNSYVVISSKSHAIIAINQQTASVTVDYGKEGVFQGDVIMYGTKKKCDYYCDKFIERQDICFTDDKVEVNPSKKLKSNSMYSFHLSIIPLNNCSF